MVQISTIVSKCIQFANTDRVSIKNMTMADWSTIEETVGHLLGGRLMIKRLCVHVSIFQVLLQGFRIERISLATTLRSKLFVSTVWNVLSGSLASTNWSFILHPKGSREILAKPFLNWERSRYCEEYANFSFFYCLDFRSIRYYGLFRRPSDTVTTYTSASYLRRWNRDYSPWPKHGAEAMAQWKSGYFAAWDAI